MNIVFSLIHKVLLGFWGKLLVFRDEFWQWKIVCVSNVTMRGKLISEILFNIYIHLTSLYSKI